MAGHLVVAGAAGHATTSRWPVPCDAGAVTKSRRAVQGQPEANLARGLAGPTPELDEAREVGPLTLSSLGVRRAIWRASVRAAVTERAARC